LSQFSCGHSRGIKLALFFYELLSHLQWHFALTH
jgi:hypothetical protein